MTDNKLVELCQETLESTQRHGADEAEVYGESVRTITVVIEKSDLQISRAQQETTIGVRALVGKRMGFSSTNDLSTLDEASRDAVILAKASPADEKNILLPVADIRYVDGIYDPKAEGFAIEQAIGYAIQILDLARGIDRRLILGDGMFSVEIGERALVNSHGGAPHKSVLHEKGSLFSYFALATARDGDKVSNMDYQFDASHTVAGIDIKPITRRACENALGSLGAEKGESFNGTVLLSPNAVQGILAGLILFQTNAKNVLRGMSRWGTQIGESIAAPIFSVIDDGLLPAGLATASFDREGVAHKRFALIQEGSLTALMHNSYSANAMGKESTGHASGSARSIPGIGPTNFEILAGAATKDELIGDIKQGLLVTRFSGRADPISGDFSGVAKGAYLIKNGKLDRPVSGTLVSGNAFQALKDLSGVSKERERVFNFTLPYLRLEGISVTAG
ncbi:MAG: TldD/PmbA family protein [Candidatus Bipolaricaulota bacterium]|nr:TldD/PmbA family protein [Candidatus Bipolaricaulota bacterium]